EASTPVLRLSADLARSHAAMFVIYDGKVTFRDLRFRLTSGGPDKAKSRSVVSLAGNGQATFLNCAATLTESNGVGGGDQAFASVVGEDDSGADGPKVELRKCFVRGRGDLLLVRGSRPFVLDLDNSLIALDGSLASVLGQPKEPRLTPEAQIT